ncbi:MAG TPA: hypothetical protein PLY70_00850 [Saprospiraceae bacterium]|nr:hypothetical protein [Saprospiraceae bacterium]HPN69089.1 hypothetical protein [Saprospiraceae bacterium]
MANKRGYYKICYIFSLLLIGLGSYGQSVSIATPQKDSILFGESTVVSFAINQIPTACKAVIIDLGKIKNLLYDQDTIMFEKYADVMVDIPDPDIANYYDEGAKKLTIPIQAFSATENQAINLAVKFLSYGSFAIPPALLQDEQGIIQANYTPGKIMVRLQNEVISDTSLTISDIKPIAEVKPSIWSWLKYVILVLVLLLLAYYVYKKYLKSRKEAVSIEPVQEELSLAPHIEALEELYKLKANQSWRSGDAKEFQTDLTFIIKRYLERKFEFGALEMTSDEVVAELKRKKITATTWTLVIDDVLHIADLVKFAKAQPEDNIHEEFVDKAIDFVEATKNSK